MADNTLAKDVTNTPATEAEAEIQADSKSYTQQEVDNMMARMRGSLEKKLLKPYEDLGDPEELRQLRTDAEKRQQDQQIKRGEFEKTLQELASKKDLEISRRDNIIREYRINTPLVSAAAKHRSVNPDQVKALLMSNVRLNAEGEVEVVDVKGSVRYNDQGAALEVDDLVREFLDSNPHFVQSTPASAHARSSNAVATDRSIKNLDISKLDMKNPQDRDQYREYRKLHGIA
jgi:hypothetical protein